jgi:signal transduction histidine kinase/ABC-type amino acid transport substrate-binding protein/ActR/RegA family two-component response regulator
MRRNRGIKILFIMTVISVMVSAMRVSASSESSASDSAKKSLRFGIVECPGYCYYDTGGNIDGVNAEYAYMIAQTANLSAGISAYKNQDDALAALDSGDINVLCIMNRTDELQEKYTFAADADGAQCSMMFSRSDRTTKAFVENAIAVIEGTDPLYYQKLVSKYQDKIIRKMEKFNNGEKKYISAHAGGVTIAVLKDDRPYYYRKHDGSAGGIIPDLYRYITEKTGMKFSYAEYDNQEEAVEAVRNGKNDILGVYSNGLIYAHDSGLRITQPFTTTNAVMITKAGTNLTSVKRIAVKNRNSLLIGSSLGEYKDLQYVSCASAQACFDCMKRGDADAVICGLPSAMYLVNSVNPSAYHLNTLSSLSIDLCSATSYDNNILCSILNKAMIACAYSFDSIMADNTYADATFISMLSRVPPLTVILIGSFLLLLIIGLIVSYIQLVHRQREKNMVMAEKEENDREKLRIEAIEKSANEKNRFFSNISHDMRTPLNAIIGFSNIAQKEELTPRAADCIEKIQSSGKLLLELINDTLTVSKMNSGKLTLNPSPVQLSDILSEVILSINTAAREKGVSFDVDRSGLVERVVIADKLNVEKILLNLLSNAVKYTPEGGHVWFTVKDEYTGGEYPETVAVVKDNGIGISREFMSRIYEPFAQEEDHSMNGTGLGLSIVKQLLDLMSGRIEVESEKGKGTTFTVRFTFQTVTADTVLKPAPSRSRDSRILEGRKILLCEDNVLNQEVATAILTDKKMKVVCAVNGKEGADIFAASDINEYDAVLMDIHMPVMDGYTATGVIRSMKRADSDIPVIAMTADAFTDDVQKARDAGMNDHIAKPVDPEKVYSLLIRYIRPVK